MQESVMEHIDKGAMFSLSSNNKRIEPDYPEAILNMGVAIAFVVVFFGWVINKIFRRDLLW